ncbi:MAG: hypothetical protein DDT33_01656 [Firmicutes bacterium]|nr:hypothetical protein [Bacillota bacterium]
MKSGFIDDDSPSSGLLQGLNAHAHALLRKGWVFKYLFAVSPETTLRIGYLYLSAEVPKEGDNANAELAIARHGG